MTRAERKIRLRQRILGIFYLTLATVMVIAFGLPVAGDASSTFTLTLRTAPIPLPNLVLPSAGTAYLLAGVVAFAGAIQLTRGFGARWTMILGLVAAVFVFAFLTWVAAGQSMNLTGVLESTVQRSVPIVFGAMSGILCE
ncbi:MAG: ABC transporter permease, partial [Candidatus Limnocylindria bacterium]